MDTVRTNGDVAAVFQGIADMLEAQGENMFKIRAYRNAVRTLEELNEPVAGIAGRGELRRVPGFGEAITAKVGEILATGTCELHERLKAEQRAGAHPEPLVGIEVGSEPAHEGAEEDLPSPW